MADHFGIPQLTGYLKQMGLKIARIEHKQEIIELAFHGKHGQWRMIVGIQQTGETRKLMLIAPHIGSIKNHKRLECLEALMAVNYRIAMGKFGIDLDDGEVRLEEALPLANDQITFTQFKLAFGALMQTVSMYQSLLPRIIYANLSVQEALQACEQAFLHDTESAEAGGNAAQMHASEQVNKEIQSEPELNIHDVLAEVSRIFGERAD